MSARRWAICGPRRCRPDQHDVAGAVVALDDLVGDAGLRPPELVGAEDGRAQRKAALTGGRRVDLCGARGTGAALGHLVLIPWGPRRIPLTESDDRTTRSRHTIVRPGAISGVGARSRDPA